MNAADDGGVTKRQALESQLERAEIDGKRDQTAKLEAALTMPELPQALEYLWRAYGRLRRRKGTTDLGSPLPLEWPDLLAFSHLSGTRLAPWEIEILERIDDLFIYRDERPAESASRPMTEQLFDSIFA